MTTDVFITGKTDWVTQTLTLCKPGPSLRWSQHIQYRNATGEWKKKSIENVHVVNTQNDKVFIMKKIQAMCCLSRAFLNRQRVNRENRIQKHAIK